MREEGEGRGGRERERERGTEIERERVGIKRKVGGERAEKQNRKH